MRENEAARLRSGRRAVDSAGLRCGSLQAEDELGDLNGVRRGALADLVGAAEERERAVEGRGVGGKVAAHAADVDEVLVARKERHRVLAVVRIVAEDDAGSFGEELAGLVGRDVVLELKGDGLGVGAGMMGTRTQVQAKRMVSSWSILRPSFCIFISSEE